MTLDDHQLESLLRKLPLTEPSTSLDARVMAQPTLKLNLWRMAAAGSSLAAAAAIIVAVALNWPTAPNTPPAVPPVATNDLTIVRVEPVVKTIGEPRLVPVGDNLPPVYQITREKFERTTWVDKTNGVHFETTSAPRREIILIQQEVK